jgi:xanthine dehydrogenase small subunit
MEISKHIEFLLDGEKHRIDFNINQNLKPSTTVLNYLRSFDNHKGVKEGCAEGDCGACTVVVASPGENGKLNFEAIDSCLVFLPMINGKQLITVENLSVKKDNKNQLHPVQKAMVSQNGSQCGYCTPGIVMSTFALFKNHHKPSREVVLDSLTGNLCRCTGYNSIVKAAHEACQHESSDQFTTIEKQVFDTLVEIKKNTTNIELEGCGQKYLLPATFHSALEYRQLYPEALVVSGATDVALRQTKKGEHFPIILDLSGIDELKTFDQSEKYFTFGAGLSLEKVKSFAKDNLPALYSMLSVFGSLQIRNLATLGGNVGSASPIGDTLPILFAYNALVNLACSDGSKRSIHIEDFITGYRQTALKNNELIYSISIPKTNNNCIVKSYKVSRRKDLDISTVSAAFALQKNGEGIVDNIKIAYGGMAANTQRAIKAEGFLKNKIWTMDNIQKAMEIIEGEFTPLSDARSDATTRRIAASNLLLKFYNETN